MDNLGGLGGSRSAEIPQNILISYAIKTKNRTSLIIREKLEALSKLVILAGTRVKYREIDVQELMAAIGSEKARGLIGLHNFSGADWVGKFVGISKTNWTKSYLSLDADES